MTTKITLTEQINSIAYEGLTEEQFSFLKARALMSIRKSRKSNAPTKTQKENAGYKTQILTLLGEKGKMTATQVGAEFGWAGSQKATALLSQLMKDGEVIRTEEGKIKYFSLAEVEETEEEEEVEDEVQALPHELEV